MFKNKHRRRAIYSVALLIFLSLFYLHLVGEGYLIMVAHSMMKNVSNTGFFQIKEGSGTSMDCAELYKRFPELLHGKNVITNPIPLEDGSGLYERFFKIDKSVIDTSNMSWKDRMAVSMASSEAKCSRSLGTFIDAIVNNASKK